eukprot:g27466.t1
MAPGAVEDVHFVSFEEDPHVGSSSSDFDIFQQKNSRGLYFAGEHTCRLMYGSLQAAAVSGARAALQVISATDLSSAWPFFQKNLSSLCDSSLNLELTGTCIEPLSGRAFKGGQDQFDSPVRAQDELAPSSRQDPWHIDVRYVVTVLRAMLCRICAGLLAPTLGSLWPPKCQATSRAGQVRGRDVQSDFNGASARYGFEDSKLLGSSWMDRSVLESQEQDPDLKPEVLETAKPRGAKIS